ncbi:hypothetical protein [Actinotalea sp.]|uniref:hypothetical protein n=1 Tax=Actinotalea sp. TaxID=1872145 RepID=UPI0035659679
MTPASLRSPRTWPWWAQVLVVAVAARVISAVIFLAVARTQAATPWSDPSPGYLVFTGDMWDAGWYRSIAEEGYPTSLPRGGDGLVLQNAWAFFPLFPVLVRGISLLSGGTWTVIAPLLATVLGLAAMLVVHQVVAHAMTRPAATGLDRSRRGARDLVPLLTVALLATSASAPVLQVAYTESLALLLVSSVILAVQRERYGAAAVLVVALGLTRAVALPMAVVVLAHAVARWPGLAMRRRVGVVGLLALTVLSGFAWPAVVGRLTGVPDAYTLTQGAWRARQEVVLLLPWLDVARWLLGAWGILALGVLVATLVVTLASRPMRRLGPELLGWAIGYVGYLLVVVEPGTSLARFAILAVPFWAALAQPVATSRHRGRAVAALVVVGVLGQIAWIGLLWRLVPPSGWPP